jgi:hypothetical protein
MFNPQGNFYPQTGFYPQANFNPQANIGAQAFQAIPGSIPFAHTLYGVAGMPQSANWQYLGHQQAALQQHAIQQLVAQQLAAQQQRQLTGMSNGLSNGVGQLAGAWTQQQLTPEQFNPTLQPPHHVLQQLAQYHHLVAQQLAQLAAQQAIQGSASPLPYAGQFIPGAGQFVPNQFVLPNQFGAGANYVPGITMH